MYRFEWKKLLHYRRGAILIAVFLLAELAGMLLFTQPYDRELEANRGVYDRYLAQVEGPLTEGKREFIEGEMERLNQVHRDMEQLKNDYYTGAVTEDAYRAQFAVLVADDQDYAGFSKLYSQYIFVRETELRSFLYTGGWEVLFGDQEPDYLFLLLLIFLLTPVFCQEYSSQMDVILLTQRKSARCLWRVKILTALAVTAILTAVLQVMELIYCALRFGLPHWDFSLQSIMSFGTTAKELTLWQAFVLQFLLKEVGYLYCAVLLLFFSVFFRRFNLALMAGIAALPLPFLTVSGPEVFLRVPGPWALTVGSLFLNSTVSYRNSLTGETVNVFTEMSWGETGLLLAAVGVIAGAVLWFIRGRNTNHHAKPHGKKRVLAACLACLLLVGCGGEPEPVAYNTSEACWFENEDYVIFSYGLDDHMLVEKQTGQVRGFPLDALQGETASAGTCFYEYGGRLYYKKVTDLHPTGGYDSTYTYEVLAELDLQTLEERVYVQFEAPTDWFFGLLEKPGEYQYVSLMREFFLHGRYIYYMVNNDLYRMDRRTGAEEPYMSMPNVSNNAYDGQNLYYTDSYNRLVLRNLDTGAERVVEEVVADDFLLTPEGIYFLNRRDSNTLYYWEEAAGEVHKLDDTPAYQLYWDENYLWITASGDLSLYRMNHDGGDRRKVECPGYVICLTRGEALYLEDHETGTIYSVHKESLQASAVPKE